jgi:hypothetical protein
MAEGRNLLRIVRLHQDESGRITGGMVLYPPNEEGKKLNAKEAQAVYDCESIDGFEIWQRNDVFYVTPLFGDVPNKKIEARKSEKANIGALLQELHPLLEYAPQMGERTAVIYEQPIEV